MNCDEDTYNKLNIELVGVKFTSLTDKLVKDGKTAILTTDKWGLNIDIFRCDPIIITLLLDIKEYKRNGNINEIKKYNEDVDVFNDNIYKQIIEYCNTKYTYTSMYDDIWSYNLKVNWIQTGTFFTITNCGDNGESIITVQTNHWIKA